MVKKFLSLLLVAAVMLAMSAPSAKALDDATRKTGEQTISHAIDFLRKNQNPDGSWTPQPGPAITGLVLAAMLRSPDIDRHDKDAAEALGYILARQKPDGGIYDKGLRNYNTAICVMALAQAGKDHRDVAKAIQNSYKFFRDLQWTDQTDPQGKKVSQAHPYYGGAGYNDASHGRPDMSNTVMMLSALHDSGLSSKDPLYRDAMVYVSRCQGIAENDMFAKEILQDGGFIYATSIDRDNIGIPQTRTDDSATERVANGGEYEGPLPTYGSMTYAGYMSYLYADLDRKDPRVVAARKWIAENYTVQSNPRMGEKSYYYYIHFMARALQANGEDPLEDAQGVKHDWRADIINALAKRQNEDGSWLNNQDKWMEGDKNLVTAYALIALQTALGR